MQLGNVIAMIGLCLALWLPGLAERDTEPLALGPDLSPGVGQQCPIIPNKAIWSGESTTEKKQTYISWNPALAQAIENATNKTGEALETAVALGAQDWMDLIDGKAKSVKDVGGKAQQKFTEAVKNTLMVKKTLMDIFLDLADPDKWKEEIKSKFNVCFELLKVDPAKQEIGLLTGGTYQARQDASKQFNKDYKLYFPGASPSSQDIFFPLHPPDETKLTLKAALPAWKTVWTHNKDSFGVSEKPCSIVILMAGSTDLHAGVVSDEVENTFTIINYKEDGKECYKDGTLQECGVVLKAINEKINEIGITVVGGSTEFKLKDYLSNLHLDNPGNMFVRLDDAATQPGDLPHQQVDGLVITGTLLLAARG